MAKDEEKFDQAKHKNSLEKIITELGIQAIGTVFNTLIDIANNPNPSDAAPISSTPEPNSNPVEVKKKMPRSKSTPPRNLDAEKVIVLYSKDSPLSTDQSAEEASGATMKMASAVTGTQSETSLNVAQGKPYIDINAFVYQPGDDDFVSKMKHDNFQRYICRTDELMGSTDIYSDFAGPREISFGDKPYQMLAFNQYFYDEKWSKHRGVTALDWSLHFPELLVAGYNNNEHDLKEPEGVCLIWNSFNMLTPQHVFHCPSEIVTANFVNFHPNLVIGGSYNGQIFMWDTRANRRTPIAGTSRGVGHKHPVFRLHLIGNQSDNTLTSVSSDGRLCLWSLDMLKQPQELMSLDRRAGFPNSFTCADFPFSETTNFLVGGDENFAYWASRQGTAPAVGVINTYVGHRGPLTGISINNVHGSIDFSDTFVTSSMDWSVKLWNVKDRKPTCTFEYTGDNAMDVSWSPIHPALFACVDAIGRLNLWDINQSTDEPAATVVLGGKPRLHKVTWSNSGLHVTVGDATGRVSMYNVAKCLAHPKRNAWTDFLHTLQELRHC